MDLGCRGACAIGRGGITIEETFSGSRVTYEADIKTKGIHRLAQPFLGRTFGEMGRKALAGLKKELDQAS